MEVKIQVNFFWVVTQCSVMVCYHNTTMRHNTEELDLERICY